MATKIFVNVPVRDLEKSKAFFTALGFTINPQFTDETASCVVISEDIYAMILTHEKFKQFTPKEISDASRTSEVLIALSFDSKEQVNELVDIALKNGATVASEPQDHGFMFTRSFSDPDGHIWEFFWMDPANIQTGT
jgi:predicted lactoylglutathione lyase